MRWLEIREGETIQIIDNGCLGLGCLSCRCRHWREPIGPGVQCHIVDQPLLLVFRRRCRIVINSRLLNQPTEKGIILECFVHVFVWYLLTAWPQPLS